MVGIRDTESVRVRVIVFLFLNTVLRITAQVIIVMVYLLKDFQARLSKARRIIIVGNGGIATELV